MTDLPDDTLDDADSTVFARLAAALQTMEISEAQRSRMRLRIRELAASQPPAGTITLRATQDEWQALSPLVRLKVLRVDTVAGNQTVLIRADPGGVLPRHRHSQDEEFIVLEGECRIGKLRLAAGDAHFAVAGSLHEDITTETGVLVLLRGEYPLAARA
jgi:quercetin dioxygenase-like cupin family protein